MQVILKIYFLSFNNTNIEFGKLKELTWRSYTTSRALPTISQLEYIDKGEFIIMALNENLSTFIVYSIALKIIEIVDMAIYLSQIAQIAIF